jgi:hypothetical protein
MALTKGEERKLAALKKSIGDDIGQEAFDKWKLKKDAEEAAKVHVDETAELIKSTVHAALENNPKLKIPKTGYTIKQGRGRVIVEPVNKD